MDNNKTRIWFLNQNSYMPEDGPHTRHYTLGKYLARNNYEPYVFAGNELHHVGRRIDTNGADYLEKESEGVRFYYVKTTHYEKNNYRRILNILSYYKRIFKVAKSVADKYGKPDVIYASSMYPTAIFAGLKLAKKYNVKCICEHRDIVPDGFVTKGTFKANGLMAKIARKVMKGTYEKADALVFTMEGGKQYLVEQQFDTEHGGKVDMSKVYCVNNGVDLEVFKANQEKFVLKDADLDNPDQFNVVYFGAIRFMNQMPLFIDTARELKRRNINNIKILMWGAGTKLDEMQKKLDEEKLDNIVLKGYIDKKYIPGIAKRADLFIGTGNSSSVGKYGMSFNKLFDYLAGGKPIILPFKAAYSIVQSMGSGVELKNPTGKQMADAIYSFSSMSNDEYDRYCRNAKNAALKYDYCFLSDKVNSIVKECLEDRNC